MQTVFLFNAYIRLENVYRFHKDVLSFGCLSIVYLELVWELIWFFLCAGSLPDSMVRILQEIYAGDGGRAGTGKAVFYIVEGSTKMLGWVPLYVFQCKGCISELVVLSCCWILG